MKKLLILSSAAGYSTTKLGVARSKGFEETLYITNTGHFVYKTIRVSDQTCTQQGMISPKKANQWRLSKLKGQEQIDSFAQDYLRISSQLKIARLNMGISQKELGAKVGLWQCQVSAYETGSQTMNIQKLFVFCIALNVKPESLLLGRTGAVTEQVIK